MKFFDLKTNDFHVIDASINCKDVIDIISKLESGYVIISSKRRRAYSGSLYLYDRKDLLEALQRLRLEHGYNIAHVSVNKFVSPPQKFGQLSVTPVNVVVDVNVSELARSINTENPMWSTPSARCGIASRSTTSARFGKTSRSTSSTGSRTRGGSISALKLLKHGGLTTNLTSKLRELTHSLVAESDGNVINKPIRRVDSESVTRQLVGELNSEVKLHSRISLKVTLTSAEISGNYVASFIANVGSKIDIIVYPLDLLRLATKNPATKSLTVQEPQKDQTIEFELVADGVGLGRIQVCAFHCGANIATLELTTKIVEDTFDSGNAHGRETKDLELVRRNQPDVSLYIFERDKELQFFLQSVDRKYNMTEFGIIKLNSPREYFQNYFRDIENLPLETTEDRTDAMDKLAEQGLYLFSQAVPVELQKLLWELRDRVNTFQVLSDEPWVPWEVCKLQGRLSSGEIKEGPFFAEAFNITRWFRGVPAITRLTLSNIALIVPEDSELENSKNEKLFISSLTTAGRAISAINPTLTDVKTAMSKGIYDAWHFAGHANASVTTDANQSSIILTNGKKLTPSHITGNAENMLSQNPFVFLNACQSARGGFSLSGGGGWAQRLIKVKQNYPSASAFIGTYWSVEDDKALNFAKEFYKLILEDGKPIGEAAKEARLKIKHDNDPAWLAYTVYADPFAKIE